MNLRIKVNAFLFLTWSELLVESANKFVKFLVRQQDVLHFKFSVGLMVFLLTHLFEYEPAIAHFKIFDLDGDV